MALDPEAQVKVNGAMASARNWGVIAFIVGSVLTLLGVLRLATLPRDFTTVLDRRPRADDWGTRDRWEAADGPERGPPPQQRAPAPPEVRAKWESLKMRAQAHPGEWAPVEALVDFLVGADLAAEALPWLEQAMNADPTKPVIRRRLADTHRRMGSWDEAAVQFAVMVEDAPADLPPLVDLAEAYLSGGRQDSALKVLASASKVATSDVGLLTRLCDLFRVVGDRRDVVATSLQLVKIDPRNPAWLVLA